MESTLVDAKEMGRRIGLDPQTVKRMARHGQIPVIKINPRVIRFDPNEVIAALKEAAK